MLYLSTGAVINETVNELVVICSIGIGIVAGLRSMTAPAIVSWAAYLGWLHAADGPFSFVASWPIVALLTVWAVFELVLDKTSKIGNRTGLVGVVFRVVTSTFSAAVLSKAAGAGSATGMVFGLVGGMIGTFGGYYLRRECVRNTSLSDLPVAIAEDIIAIGLGVACAYFAAGPGR